MVHESDDVDVDDDDDEDVGDENRWRFFTIVISRIVIKFLIDNFINFFFYFFNQMTNWKRKKQTPDYSVSSSITSRSVQREISLIFNNTILLFAILSDSVQIRRWTKTCWANCRERLRMKIETKWENYSHVINLTAFFFQRSFLLRRRVYTLVLKSISYNSILLLNPTNIFCLLCWDKNRKSSNNQRTWWNSSAQ